MSDSTLLGHPAERRISVTSMGYSLPALVSISSMEIPELNHVCYQVTNGDADTLRSLPLAVMMDGNKGSE